MNLKKRKEKENSTVLFFRAVILFIILVPALLILIPACNPFEKKGTCGKPGYYYSGKCNNLQINYTCTSPCEPSTPWTFHIITLLPYTSTTTVYCSDPDEEYETSDGVNAIVTACTP